MTDPYAVDAEFYDLLHGEGGDDISLWLAMAGGIEGRVLEVGTGTGRIALALVGAGHMVSGVDPSTAMLSLARQKADDAGLDVRFESGSLVEVPPGLFELVIVGPNVFLHCETAEQQLESLATLASAVAPGGRLALDLPGPADYLDGLHNGEPVLVYSAAEGEGRLEAWQVHEDDLAEQTRILSMRYERTLAGGNTWRAVSEQRLRYVFRFEMEHLLRLAGLGPWNLFGDYDLGGLTGESERMIFVAGRGDQ